MTCAEDLLKCLKEGLIEELVFVSTAFGTDNRKRKQCKKFFPKLQYLSEIRATILKQVNIAESE